MDSDSSQKIQELQMMEQNLQALLMQKQSMQVEMNEIQNALNEVERSSDDVYKIVGGIMVKSSKDSILKELNDKKKILDIRIQAFEKQEKLLEEKSRKMREEVLAANKKGEKK